MAAEEEVMKMRLLVDGDGTGRNIYEFFYVIPKYTVHLQYRYRVKYRDPEKASRSVLPVFRIRIQGSSGSGSRLGIRIQIQGI